MALKGEHDNYLLVAAMDFGTTFSGYAFSFKSDPEKIVMNKNWGENLGFASYKNHTSVLTTNDGEFVDFGFDAENRYAEEVEDDEEADCGYFMFRHFKMILHKTGTLSRATRVTAVDGKGTYSALKIFFYALQYLKKHMMDALQKTLAKNPDDDMIRWVVTVPAIWTEESKQFMREAAYLAGCIPNKDSRKLIIALEPEAASLCCRRMDIARYPDGTNLSLPEGTKYLVIDCGGGTVDITAHQVLRSGNIKELHSATGGAWGGTKVDQNFENLLRRVLSDRFIDEYKKKCPQQWLVFMTSFEKLKKSVSLREEKSLNIPLTYSMNEQYTNIMGGGKNIQSAIKAARGVNFAAGNIRIDHTTAKGLFQPVVRQIIDHVKDLLKRPDLQSCQMFFLVGGFSESSILQDMIKEEFERTRIQILIPSEAQMAVIRGAVLFGHRPQEIKSRKARLTYGCKFSQNMESLSASRRELFDSRKIENLAGVMYCNGLLHPFVVKDDEIEDSDLRGHTFSTIFADTQDATVQLFSLNRKPNEIEYVDSIGCSKVGEFIVETPGYGKGRPVHIEMTFGGTEIQVTGQSSGKPTKTTINFMTN